MMLALSACGKIADDAGNAAGNEEIKEAMKDESAEVEEPADVSDPLIDNRLITAKIVYL